MTYVNSFLSIAMELKKALSFTISQTQRYTKITFKNYTIQAKLIRFIFNLVKHFTINPAACAFVRLYGQMKKNAFPKLNSQLAQFPCESTAMWIYFRRICAHEKIKQENTSTCPYLGNMIKIYIYYTYTHPYSTIYDSIYLYVCVYIYFIWTVCKSRELEWKNAPCAWFETKSAWENIIFLFVCVWMYLIGLTWHKLD